MDYGFLVILFAIVMIFVFWNSLRDKQKSKEDERTNSRDFWLESGVTGKWWLLALNMVGILVLFWQILYVKSQNGMDLAQKAEGLGFVYIIWVMWPSVLVGISLFFFLRFEITRSNIKRKFLYAILAVTSIFAPLVLLANLSKF